VFKAHRLLYHSTLGLRVIKKKKKMPDYVRALKSAAGLVIAAEGSTARPQFKNNYFT